LLIVIIVLVMAAAFAAMLLRSDRSFQWDLFWATFRRLNLFWVAASALLALSTYLGRAFRWRVLIHPMHPKSNLWNLFTATAIGFTAIVLFGRPGEMVRPYLIAAKEKLSFSSQVGVLMLERIYDLLMALFIFGISLSYVHASRVQVGPKLQWVLEAGGYAVGIVAALCLTVLFLLRMFTETMRRRLMAGLGFLPDNYLSRIEGIVTAFTHGVQSTKSLSYVFQILLWSILEWITIVACYWCLFQASPETARFGMMEVLIFVGFVSFGAVVQIPGIGGGTQIVSVLILTELFKLSLEASSGLAVMIWVITFVVIVPFGLGLSFHDGIRWGRLRQIGGDISGVPPQSASN
jgi:uncharacterized membrane protein YbhN (UPF0104 family)